MEVTLTVNGTAHTVDIEPRELLVHVLREELRLTGTHIGCDTTSCGACTVLYDGVPVKSCTLFGVQAEGVEITTVEGLLSAAGLDPIQAAFKEHHGLQCGFCTPGMIMSAIDLVASHRKNGGGPLTERAVREGLEGNLCRCTGYHNIVRAVLTAPEWDEGGLHLVEIVNPLRRGRHRTFELAFRQSRFRPYRATSIDAFLAMLEEPRVDLREPVEALLP